MDSNFLKRMQRKGDLSDIIIEDSNTLMNLNFKNDAGYKKAKLYDCNLNFLEDVDIKFQFSRKYSINKDRVDWLVQFRPMYHPEKIYKKEDNKERLGFFLDIPNDLKENEKWLIVGKDDTYQFTRYNVLKCNWVFKYIINDVIYEQLGVLRDRNNYNSGVWSDGFVTSVQNQSLFMVPTNERVELIDYDLRFMLSDNKKNPLVYSVTKRTDTFPLGINKITLSQDHFNKSLDNAELGICDYYSSNLLPSEESNKICFSEIKFTGLKPVLIIGGSARILTGILYDENHDIIDAPCEWTFYVNNISIDREALSKRYDIETISDSQLAIKAKNDITLIGEILSIGLKNSSEKTVLNLEVKA